MSAIQRPGTMDGPTVRLAFLLAGALFINYVDRGNLAVAAPLLKDALQLSNTQIGLLLSAFYWSYTAAQLPAGWLCERIAPGRLLAYGLALWSIATGLTGFAGAFMVIFVLRLVLGLGESVVYPCVAKLLSTRAREQERGGANGIITVGTALGTAFGTLIGGLLMARFGWRAIFIIFGSISLSWLLLWRQTMGKASGSDRAASLGRPLPISKLLKNRALWGNSIGHFAGSYGSYFITGWLPLYLVKVQGFSVARMATMSSLVYLVYALSAGITGPLSDRWIAAGATPNRVRKTFIVGAAFLLTGAMIACAFGSAVVSLSAMVVAGFCFGAQTPTLHCMAQTLAGPRAAGQWMGIENFIGNFSGIIAPIITGMVVDRTGEFFWAFAIAGAVSLLGAYAWGIIIPKVEEQDWGATTPAAETVPST